MSLWHCKTHGLTGPMACCAQACRTHIAAALPQTFPQRTTVTAPLTCAVHSGTPAYRVDANGRCLGCGKTAALIRAEDEAAIVYIPTFTAVR
jgi:hypothetical protein